METAGPVDGWALDQKRRGAAPLGVIARVRLYNSFAAYLGEPILGATPADINAFLDTRRVTPRTRSGYLSWLSSFYGWAVREEMIATNPVARIPRPRRSALIPRPLATADVDMAVAMCTGTMRAWVCLAAWAGLRCKEIATLRREDIFDTADPPVLIVAEGKGDKQRVVPLNADLFDSLRSAGLPRSGYLFPHHQMASEPIRAWSISHKVAVYLQSLGIDGTAHQLRHSFGTEVYRRTRDLRLVQELLGHASPVTTAGYTKLVPMAASEVVMGISRRSVDHPVYGRRME